MSDSMNDDVKQVVYQFGELRRKHGAALNKSALTFQNYCRELIEEPMDEVQAARAAGEEVPDAMLSISAQVLIEKEMAKAEEVMTKAVDEHRSLHKFVSRCGKDLDKNFEADLCGLLQNEKDVEGVIENRQTINKLMYEFFLDTGMSEVAEALKKEAELPIQSNEKAPSEDLETVIQLFRRRDIVPLIEFLEKSVYMKEPCCYDLIFDLHRQHIIFLLEENKQNAALIYARNLQPFALKKPDEIAHLMAGLVAYPYVQDIYKDLFHANNWLVVESRLAKLVSKINSPMEVLLTIGAKAMPSMLSIKNVLTRSPLIATDELPIAVEIPNPVHSTFTCPILKVQSTESNPPIRLGCGHVISKEAVSKLSASRFLRTARNTRHGNYKMKCPYCPEEINCLENKRLHFN